jgi:uncharacterized membrane protein YphA (DoxX/SURF4 family)
LRVAIGATAVVEGIAYVSDPNDAALWSWILGVLALCGGVLLLIGFLTPIAGSLILLGALGIACSWLPAPILNLFDATLRTAFVAVVVVAVVFLGPGALSLDARLFGRREIIIPRGPRSLRS